MTKLEAISTLSTQIAVWKYHFLQRKTKATWRMLNSSFGVRNVLDEPGVSTGLLSKDSGANLKRFLLAKNSIL